MTNLSIFLFVYLFTFCLFRNVYHLLWNVCIDEANVEGDLIASIDEFFIQFPLHITRQMFTVSHREILSGQLQCGGIFVQFIQSDE